MGEPNALASRVQVQPISKPIVPKKQAAKRHYGSHPYFTKRAWNVVQQYIDTFSEPGDLVLDPFGGSGVTAVESLVLRRRAVHADIAPLANFITWGVAVSPVDLTAFQTTFAAIRKQCQGQILGLYKLTDDQIKAMPVPNWYPANVRLPSNSDVPTVESVFHRRSLFALSILLHFISTIEDVTIRDLFRLVFSATLNKTNLTFSSTTGRKESRGDSSIFRVYRYWVPKRTIELNVWEQFELRYGGWLAAKRETNQLIGTFFSPENLQIIKASATDLKKFVASESIDYIYTDPPYGAHIAYLDLMTMWHAWLGLDVTADDRKNEVIEGGDLNKSKKEYSLLLTKSIGEMFRVLKYDRWLSIVFSHKDPAYWDTIVKAAQRAGFEYVNTAVQPSTTPSLHKRKNPLTVLSGELVLNFRKVKNPRAIAITAVGPDVVQLIKNAAEVVIVRNNGAATEDIYHDLIPVLLENGRLDEVKKQIGDVTPLLAQEFDFSNVDGHWHIRPNTKLGSFIPLGDRIKFYVTDFLKRAARDGKRSTFDDIVFNVMPNLINGTQPTHQSILEVLDTIAFSPDAKHWELRTVASGISGQTVLLFPGVEAVPVLPTAQTLKHDEVIYRLAKLGKAAGLKPHVGKKEQASTVFGERLGDLAGGQIPKATDLKAWDRSKIEQIDCVYFDEEGTSVYAFEVEASTPITTGIDRFLELLKLNEHLAKKLVIVIPRHREKPLSKILRSSHYIGHPMYMENKLGYLYYEDLMRIYDTFAGHKAPTWKMLRERLDAAVRLPKLDK